MVVLISKKTKKGFLGLGEVLFACFATIIPTHCKRHQKLALKLCLIPDTLLSILYTRIYVVTICIFYMRILILKQMK
jgi:hypothetical protein